METLQYQLIFSQTERFKSYYVVWKPGAIKNTINGQPRLNRTM